MQTAHIDSIKLVRNQAFDSVRGWLILSVVVGHVVLGSIHHQFVRYAIYAVHMPLFIALTGYLINTQKLYQSSVLQSASRYWSRLVIPFIPAFVFFTGILILHAAIEGRLSTSLLLAYLTTPYYHLWFVPTLLLWVGGLALLLKARVPELLMCVLLAPLALFWAGFDMALIPTVFLSKKVFYYAYFFFLGLVCRRYIKSWQGFIQRGRLSFFALVAICAILYMSYCGQLATPWSALAWFILNTGLVLLVLDWILSHAASSQSSWLGLMGRHSLPIYLWHVVPMFLLKGLDIHQSQPFVYYLISVISCVLLIVFVSKFENRSPVLNKWFYGVV